MQCPVSSSLALQETESEMRRLEEHQRVMQDNLQKSAEDISVQLAQVSSTKSQLEEQKQVRGRWLEVWGWSLVRGLLRSSAESLARFC